MPKTAAINAAQEQDQLKGFARTITEIEWLLLVLVLVYLVTVGRERGDQTAIYYALLGYGAFILVLHYAQFFKREAPVKLTIETMVMVVFVTWVAWNTGKIDSPLLNLYLLPIIASALILGKLITSLETGAVILAYMVMAYDPEVAAVDLLAYFVMVLGLIAPVVLVAYITTMLAADIHYAVTKIKRISETDELTGVYNMRAFLTVVRRTLQQSVRHAHPLSIAMMDSDNLKLINDNHGHESGNRLLQHLIRKTEEEIRGSDVLARYGGDEFIILLPETQRDGAIDTAERIRKSVERSRFDVRGKDQRVTVSIGLASYPEDGADIDVLIEKADKALYRAKRNGRNQIATYEVEADETVAAPSRPGLK